jgi:Na+/proline symporter
VVWNDVVQLLIYLGGAALALLLILDRIPGGWTEVVAVASPDQKFRFLNPEFDFSEPYTLLAGLVGGAFLTFATHGTDQMMVQRYLACGSRRKSQVALVVSGVVVWLQFLLFLVIGVMLYAYYRHFPMGGELGHINEIFPKFILEEMPPGLSGLIIAAIFAAAMSTLSSSLNSLSSSALNDFYRSRFVPVASEAHYLKVSRFLTLGWGGVLIVISMLARTWGELLEAGLTITSFTMGSVLGIFLLGVAPRKVSQKAALLGMTAGLAVMLAVHQILAVAWTWYVLIGTTCTFCVGWTASRAGLGRDDS